MAGDNANFMIGLLLATGLTCLADIKVHFVNTGTIHVLIVAGCALPLVAAIMYTLFRVASLARTGKKVLRQLPG